MDFLLGGGAAWFTVPAFMGTLFLVLQMVLGQLGGHDGSSADGGGFEVDHGGDLGGHDGDFDHADHSGEHAGHDADAPGHEFRMLSLQSIAAFAMGGGWVGLAAYQALHWSFGASVLAALGAGVGIAWMMVTLLRQFLKLQSSGNIAIGDAIGEHGTVYVQIPPAGTGSGRVVVSLQGRKREFNAVQGGTEFIASHTSVRVVDVDRSANALRVEPA